MYDSRRPKIKSKLGKVKNAFEMNPSTEDRRAGTSMGCGDYYGTGFKNKIGKLRSDTVGYSPVSRQQMGKPPKSLA